MGGEEISLNRKWSYMFSRDNQTSIEAYNTHVVAQQFGLIRDIPIKMDSANSLCTPLSLVYC